MRHLTRLLIAASLFVLTPQASRAQLPTCGNVMQFGVDCQIGSVEAGGIALTGLTQTFSSFGSGVTTTLGGSIAFSWQQTSASTSLVRLTFDAALLGAVHATSSGSTVQGTETLRMSLAALDGGRIQSAMLGVGNAMLNPNCSMYCGGAQSFVNQSINGSFTNTTGQPLNAATVAIVRQSTARAWGQTHQVGTRTYSCGWFSTCTEPVFFTAAGSARTPDQWTYEFALTGTGPAASPPTVAVPEPGSLALLSAGLATWAAVRRRRARLA